MTLLHKPSTDSWILLPLLGIPWWYSARKARHQVYNSTIFLPQVSLLPNKGGERLFNPINFQSYHLFEKNCEIDKIFFFVRSLENSANNSDSIYDWTILLFGYRVPAGEKEKKSTVSIIQTKPSETKEKVAPAIQPSKTYKTNTEEETKKQVKGTKVVVNSVIEQNVINSSEDNGSRSVKDQVRLI